MKFSRFMCKLIPVTFAIALTCGAIFGCEKPEQPAEQTVYTSLRDVPGITENEIAAVEALREKGTTFVYGMCPNTEAFYNTEHEISGFAVLFCAWLTDLFDIPFEPALYEWRDLISGLESGEIDFTGELTADTERRMTYLMTEAIAARSIKTFRLTGSQPIEEIEMVRPLRLAFMKNTTTIKKVTPYLNYDYVISYIDDYAVAYQMLSDGAIDVFFDEHPAEATFDSYGNITAEDFFPLAYDPVSLSTQNPDLAVIISVVQKTLENGSILTLNELYNQGYIEYNRHRLFQRLTEEERAYLNTHTVIPFAAEFDNYPKSFYNTNEKEWQGIVFDVLQEVEILTGLEFKVANGTQTKFISLLDMLWKGEALFISELVRTKIREGDYVWPQSTILTDQYVLISSVDFHDINFNEIIAVRIGLQKGSAYSESFTSWFPEHRNIQYYDSSDEAFNALTKGEVDMVMESLYTLLHLTNYKEMVGYKANFVFNNSFESLLGFNKNEAVLCSIIDKALEEIDTKTISGQWLNKTYDYRAKLAEAQRPWIIGAMILLALSLLLLTIMFYRKRKTDQLAMETKIREQTLAAQNTMLDALNRMKNEFFQNMSHDLKTPLTVISTDILNAADYLDFDMDKEDMRKSLSHAQSEIMRMARMVDSALKYSSMQEYKDDMEPMDIASLLREGGENYRAVLERNNNRLTLDIPKTLPLILGNADTLLHVLSNLLSNSNHHTRNGEISIHAAEANNNISVTVSDSGTGIKPELLRHIFERGVSESGTGLGLSICKSAVEALGGDIFVESEYGHGTAITFMLPACKEENANG